MYTEKLAQIKNTFDPKIILAVSSVDTENNLRKIIEKYHIHADVAGEAYSVLMLLAYGVMGSNECFNIINNLHAVNTDDFANFISDINAQVLTPIQNQLRKEVEQKINKPVQTYDENLITPAKKNTTTEVVNDLSGTEDNNNDDDHDETAEEILARIDKEVEDEIAAEIEAEMAQEAVEKERQKAEAEMIEKQKNVITADFDLDVIPKTDVPTYAHTQNSIVEEKNEPVKNSQSSLTNFIEAKATGNIVSINDKNYIRDPYHEEL